MRQSGISIPARYRTLCDKSIVVMFEISLFKIQTEIFTDEIRKKKKTNWGKQISTPKIDQWFSNF